MAKDKTTTKAPAEKKQAKPKPSSIGCRDGSEEHAPKLKGDNVVCLKCGKRVNKATDKVK